MEDLNKNAKTEKPIEVQKDSNKVASGGTEITAKKPAERKIVVKTKELPTPAKPAKKAPEVIDGNAQKAETPKEAKPSIKKASTTTVRTEAAKSSVKKKAEPMVQNVLVIASTEEQEKPKSDKKEIKVIKTKAKKAEQKVDKLKKKVKKAKKKEVKKSKIKDLKDKLGKALKKFKASVEKLKEEKK